MTRPSLGVIMEKAAHIVAPCRWHTHTIIFLHGRDSTGTEFAAEFFESQASDDLTLPEIFPTTRWVFPTSRIRPSARFQVPMSQWFDMWSVENHSEKNEIQIEGLRESVDEILNLIRTETVLVPLDRIILGGISQGCATAIHTLLSGGVRLGGFIGLSSWLPFEPEISTSTSDNVLWSMVVNKLTYNPKMLRADTEQAEGTSALSDLSSTSALDTPTFLSHSEDDDVVPVANGKRLSETLTKLGMAVWWKKYEDGGHWVNEPHGVDDIASFISAHQSIKEEDLK
ncbi:Acyl-protein thioesterase [Lachnellula suecica]|uniref:Acyl-protein thioesterase n=1 Tax=Lachnellula suecica TaxID=602035 RepID=A0A8T9CC89_9HELO|nr:Acyl-protein thioesterase [Lachnellula suecica]